MKTTMKKILLAACVICLGTVGVLKAQNTTTLTYSIGFPSGDLKDFIGATSFRGFTFDFQKMVQDNIGVGVSVGWNVFYEDMGYDTYTVDNISLSGQQWRYSNHIPILLSSTFQLKPGDSMNPYVGLGTGVTYTLRNTDMNLYTVEQDAWNFTLQPAIGVLIEASDVTKVNISARYNQAFKAGNELEGAQSYFSLNFGFTFGN
jgi:Outer membrane protein beta-barrel domain